MKRKNKLLILWMFQYILYGLCSELPIKTNDGSEPVKDSRGLFSPRMDYEQWKPLGRGDPLKNDPTYDYVPPVLDRVRYWIDPSSRQPDPPIPQDLKKTEILVLGVSSKKPSTASAPPILESRRDTYDPYLKFIEAPKYQYYNTRSHHKTYSGSFYSPPYYHTKTKFDPDKEDRVPYTMLMPPPMQTPSNITFPQSVRFETTTDSGVSIAASNLIFQSSTNWDYATVAEPSSQVTWRTPSPPERNFTEVLKITHKPFRLTPRPNYVLHPNHLKFPSVPSMNYRKPVGFSFESKPTTLQTIQTTTIANKVSFPDQPTPLLQNYLQSESKISEQIITTPTPTTTTTTTTTTTQSPGLTADPLFSHYKQPSSPIKGPMYLIIQGHSKVKTYAPKPSIHGIQIQETNDLLSKSNDHETNHISDREDDRRLRISKDLQTLQHLLKTGQGAIDLQTTVSKEDDGARQKRNFDIKEAVIGAQYKVVERGEVQVTEKYRKGFVEAGDISDLKRTNLTYETRKH